MPLYLLALTAALGFQLLALPLFALPLGASSRVVPDFVLAVLLAGASAWRPRRAILVGAGLGFLLGFVSLDTPMPGAASYATGAWAIGRLRSFALSGGATTRLLAIIAAVALAAGARAAGLLVLGAHGGLSLARIPLSIACEAGFAGLIFVLLSPWGEPAAPPRRAGFA